MGLQFLDTDKHAATIATGRAPGLIQVKAISPAGEMAFT